MTQLQHLPRGGQARDAWSKPPRSKAERREHVLRKLESDDKLWIDGPITVVSPEEIDDEVAERLSRASAIDGRKAPGFVYLQLTPRRVQAWWSGAELGSPTIMRDGQWLS